MNGRASKHQFGVTGPTTGQIVTTPPIRDPDAISVPNVLFFVDAPALTTAQLPDGQTVTYALLEGNDPTMTTFTSRTVMGIQTGAGGAGAPAATFCARAKFVGGSLLGMQITASASANASAAILTLSVAPTASVQGDRVR